MIIEGNTVIEISGLSEQQYKPVKGRTYIGQQTYYEIYKDLESGLREFVSVTPYEWIAKDVCERYGFKYEPYYVAAEE